MSVVDVTLANFDNYVAGERMVVLDFWSPTCGPCLSFAPTFAQAADRHPDAVFGKINIQAEPALATEFDVQAVPTLLILRDRIVLYESLGAISLGDLDNILRELKDVDMAEIRQQLADDFPEGS